MRDQTRLFSGDWGIFAIGLGQKGRYIADNKQGMGGRRGEDATFEVKGGPVEFPNTAHYRGKVW